MTPEEMILEAVLVTIAKGIGVLCIVALFAILGLAFFGGRYDEVARVDELRLFDHGDKRNK